MMTNFYNKYFCFTFLLLICISIFSLKANAQAGVQDTLNQTDAQGRKQGLWRTYYKNGHLESETSYIDGKKNGIELLFYNHPNCPKEETHYTNDSISGLHMTYYRFNCRLKSMETIKGGQIHGPVKRYHRNGQLSYEAYYEDGALKIPPKEYKPSGDRKNELDPLEAMFEGYLNGTIAINDSLVLKSLELMELDENTVIVTDVTGSMQPYGGQLLLWYQQNMRRMPVKQFAFFNDGDDKPDLLKRVGRTGGIYFSTPRKLSQLKETMEEAIKKGNGGSEPENDLEAVIKAASKFHARQVVLIADRQSHVRDIALLRKIRVPVHVILCGPEGYINPQYLDIARETGGNLYTLDEQLQNIDTVEEGQTVAIADRRYRFTEGRFVLLTGE